MNKSSNKLVVFACVILLSGLLAGCTPEPVTSTITDTTTTTTTATVTETTTLISTITITSSAEPLSLKIYSPEDGTKSGINIQKITGIVSNPTAVVQINDTDEIISADGSFYAYIELAEGENTITAEATLGAETFSDTVNVNFMPLAVYLDIDSEFGVNYLTTPLTVTGFVSNAEAIVTVDGNPVTVSADGSFTAQVQLNENSMGVEAVAKLDGREDSYFYWLGVSDEGNLLMVPGWHSFYMSRILGLDEIQIQTNETKSFNITLVMGKDFKGTESFRWEVYPVSGEYQDDRIPVAGLTVNIEPAEFTAYPNTTYSLPLTIAATSKVAPGEYYLKLDCYLDGELWTNTWIKMTID
jgi:hypothetical protein